MSSLPTTKPWSPQVTTAPKRKSAAMPPPQISIPMQAPKSDRNDSPRKPLSLRHRRVTYYNLIFTWVLLFIVTCIATGAYFFPRQPLPPPPQLLERESPPPPRATAAVKIYPFNVYDDGTDRVVRYPPSGAIPKLHWNKIKHYRACCKDDDSLRCFATHEIALRRDPERSQRGIADVYLEIMRDAQPETTANWKRLGALGSRCQLIWSEEQAEIES